MPWLGNADSAIYHTLKTFFHGVTGCCLDGIVLDAQADIKIPKCNEHAVIADSM